MSIGSKSADIIRQNAMLKGDKVLNKLKLKTAILAGYSIPVSLIFVIGAIAASGISTTKDAFEQVENSQKTIILTDNMAIDSAKMSRAINVYMIDRKPKFIKEYRESWKSFQQKGKATHNLIDNPQQKARLKKMLDLGNQLNKYSAQIINLVNRNQKEQAINLFKQGRGQDIVAQLDAINNQFNSAEEKTLQQKNKQAQDSLNSLLMAIAAIGLLTLALAALTAYWISGGVARTVNQTVNVMAASSTEIAATAEQQERMVSQQSVSVNQTTTSMNELSVSARKSAERANAAASDAKQALARAEDGNQAVERTLAEISELREKVKILAEQIGHLSEQTDRIGNISNLVSELANQTNMLAINAAVEAVRAGDHGKGFAVVASEIRKLADRSKKSGEQINILVADIQKAINQTVMETEAGTKTATDALKVVQEAASAFNDTIASVNNISISTQQISHNTKQQATAIEQVLDAMNTLNSHAVQSASGVTQVRVGVQRINQAAQELQAIV